MARLVTAELTAAGGVAMLIIADLSDVRVEAVSR
jgi:hypothetical protein